MATNQSKPRSPLAWVGGKSKLTSQIIPLIPNTAAMSKYSQEPRGCCFASHRVKSR